MPDGPKRGLDLGALLEAVEDAAPVAAAEVVGRHLADALGARDVFLLIADLSGRALARLGRFDEGSAATRAQGGEFAERVPLHGSPHGRALATQTVRVEDDADGSRVFAPVTNRGETIGVLELLLAERPSAQTLAEVALVAHALAYVVIANRRFTDLFEWGRRSMPLTLAAEIQQRLLPGSYTCEAGQFTLAGWLEPAGQVGGDTFDFAVERSALHLSMTDAMGHEVDAALLATVLIGGLRNARRAGVPLLEQVCQASDELVRHGRRGGFATGQVMRVDLPDGTASIVNAGHPLPLRLRNGVVESVHLGADPPFGTVLGHEYRVQHLPLEPGDRLMLFTDGIIERNAADLDIAGMLADTADLHAREAVQHIIRAVLDATDSHLKDDATALCLDWHGGPARERTTDSGANS